MTIMEQIERGEEFNVLSDETFFTDMQKCEDKCFEYNQIPPSKIPERNALMKTILGKTKDTFWILSPFYCEYGYNIEIGKDFVTNHNVLIIDAAKVKIGDNVMIGPNSGLYTSGHSLDPVKRKALISYARPITIGDNVWIGGNSVVLAGVTIGENTVIGAGSVVTKDIPANVLAVGNPCRVIRQLTSEDREQMKENKEI